MRYLHRPAGNPPDSGKASGQSDAPSLTSSKRAAAGDGAAARRYRERCSRCGHALIKAPLGWDTTWVERSPEPGQKPNEQNLTNMSGAVCLDCRLFFPFEVELAFLGITTERYKLVMAIESDARIRNEAEDAE